MRTSIPGLLPLFRSDTQVELLSLLLLQAEREWTLEQLSDTLGAPQSSVHRELRRALDAGLVVRDDRFRPHVYRAGTSSPAYQPLRDLLDLTAGVPGRLARALGEVDGVVAAALHGSWVASTLRPDSDLDVLILTEGDRREALRAARRVGKQVSRDVDVSVMSPEQFHELAASGNPFTEKVLRGPRLDLLGDLTQFATA